MSMQVDWKQIAFENRSLNINSHRFLGEGWNCVSYLVDDELVFRFPKRASCWPELDREIRFLEFAADHLPLPVPLYLNVVEHSSAVAHGYAVYRYLRGRALDLRRLSNTQRDRLAEAIAAFLLALHSIKPGAPLDALLPREDALAAAQEYLDAAKREVFSRLESHVARLVTSQFEAYMSAPENFSFQPVVLHADLSHEHILMENDSIAGVLDFGDVNWGDADYDFMYLFVEFGETFVASVARAYGHPDPERLMIKLRYYGIADQIGTMVQGKDFAPAAQRRAAWQCLKQLA
ncbi:MAG TPA: aminoglycoside phosphotransferase family protein [Blastocatellia bacterium]|nr:aminoglycoside phosphotransferase family protein [Blastocatellia bacterium]